MHAEADAEDTLKQWWSDGEYVPLPVDPIRIARLLGLQVIESHLDPGTSGAIVKQPDKDAVILLSTSDSTQRQRFTCAHELGHFMQHPADPEYSYIEKRNEQATLGTNPAEVYANQFAAALLMPRDLVRQAAGGVAYPQGLRLAQLAYKFGVSGEAMNYRLRNLGIA